MQADTKPKARGNARPKGGHCEGFVAARIETSAS